MLSKKAKVVRGETSKRITVLFQEWRAFKERAEEEVRTSIRKHERLQEEISLKNQQIDKLASELNSYRDIVIEQRHAIEGLVKRCSDVEKYRVRHSDLEAHLKKERETANRLSHEVRSMEALLHKSAAEKEALTTLNNELKSVNHEQKRRLMICEKDVTETTLELEMLEKVVGELANRRPEYGITVMTSAAADQKRATTTPPPSMGKSRKTPKKRPEVESKAVLQSNAAISDGSHMKTSSEDADTLPVLEDTSVENNEQLSHAIDSLENLLSNSLFSKKVYSK